MTTRSDQQTQFEEKWSPNYKYKLIQRPQGIPGCCFLTRSDQEEFFVDTGTSNDLPWGNVIIGKSALEEMARLIGMEYPSTTFEDNLKSPGPEDYTPVGEAVTLESINSQLTELNSVVASLINHYLASSKELHPSNSNLAGAEQGLIESSNVEDLGSVRGTRQSQSKSKSILGDFDI